MRRKVIMRCAAIGAALLLMGAVAVETVDQLVIEPRTVSSWGELIENYLAFRTQMGPIVPPGVMYGDVAASMEKGDWSFLAQNWAFKFADGTYYVAKDSKLAKLQLPLHLLVYEDLQRSEIIILSSADGEKFQGEALFKAPAFMPCEKDFPQDKYLFDELSPRRVVWEVTLKPEAEAWTDLILQRDASAASAKLLSGGGIMMMSVPAEHTNELWLCLESQTEGGINLNVFAPEGFTNRVEIYSSTDLVSNVWSIAAQDLYPINTEPAVWNAGSEIVQFYKAGNMDIDSDSDGLPDAREVYVYKTDPNDPDTDGDGMPDGWEVQYGFNPMLYADGGYDADGDGVSNAAEYTAGTNPRISDTLTSGAAGTLSYQYDEDGRMTGAHLNGDAAIWYQNSPAHNLKTLDIYTN